MDVAKRRPPRQRQAGSAVGPANREGAIKCGRPFELKPGAADSAVQGPGLAGLVLAAARSHRLINAGDRVLVALSGGPDSVALLHALWSLRASLGITVCAAHLNHRMRGRAAAADAAAARAIARKLGIPFTGGAVDVPALARRRKLSLETAAREARKRFLERAARRLRCNLIATGHTRNDQAETIVMRVIRGTGLSGLAGIPRRNGRYVRPLLDAGRDDVLRYLAEHRLAFRTDLSNADCSIMRNRIRHRLLPALAQYNPRIVAALANLADTAGEDLTVIDQATETAASSCIRHAKSQIAIDLNCFNGYNKGLRRNILRLCVRQLKGPGVVPDFDRISAALALLEKSAAGKRFQLAGGLWIKTGYQEAVIGRHRPVAPAGDRNAGTEIALRVPGKTPYQGHTFTAKISRKAAIDPAGLRDPSRAWFDWDGLVRTGLTIGARMPGERMIPFGAHRPKKIKELMIDAKVPQALRAGWPVLRSGGRPIWIPGLRRSSAAPVTAQTRLTLILEHSSDET